MGVAMTTAAFISSALSLITSISKHFARARACAKAS